MNYLILIYQGTTPTPPSAEWDALPEDQKQAVYAGYQAENRESSPTAPTDVEEASTPAPADPAEAPQTPRPPGRGRRSHPSATDERTHR